MVRDGKKYEIMAENLVVGDLVEVQFGDRIPADIRMVECRGLKVRYRSSSSVSPLFSFKSY